MNNIKELNERLSHYEKEYSTDQWKINNIDLWPIIKMVLAFEFEKSRVLRNREPKLSISFLSKISKRVHKEIRIFFFKLFGNTNDKILNLEYFFASFPSYRENFKDKSRDKFFDAFMDNLQAEGKKSMLFEFEYSNVKNIYKKKRVFNVDRIIGFHKKKFDSSVWELENLNGYNIMLENFSASLSKDEVCIDREIKNNLNIIEFWKNISGELLDKTLPKCVFLVSYYSVQMFGLMLSCKERNIPVVEIQHGGLDGWHYCYNFTSEKFYGLNSLPDYFWLWDSFSTDTVKKWLPVIKKEKAFNGGNPWIEFLKNENLNEISGGKKIALFTLQTGIYPLIPDFLIKSIKECDEFLWIFRFHPRMDKNEIGKVKKILINNNIYSKVGIKKFSDIPLPLLLKECYMHISAFSGSLSEANILKVPINVTFHESGRNAYKELIENGDMLYYDCYKGNDFYTVVKQFIEIKGDKNKDEVLLKSKNSIESYFTSILLKITMQNK